MSETKYNTNLASEFYVLSALHRLGMQAMLPEVSAASPSCSAGGVEQGESVPLTERAGFRCVRRAAFGFRA